jgi:hypothetical protein
MAKQRANSSAIQSTRRSILVFTMRSISLRMRFALRGIAVLVPLITVNVAMSASGRVAMEQGQLGKYYYDIPERYFRDGGQVPNWLRWTPGLDHGSRELLLTIDASEVVAAVPGFKPMDGRYQDDLRLRLVALREEERRRYLDPNGFTDIWNGTDSYQNRIIETDPGTHLVRVYRQIEYPDSWEVFTVSPDKPIPPDVFSFWIGHCLSSHSPLTQSGALALCKSYVVVGDIAVNFTMSAQNLSHMADVRNYLTMLVREWLRDGLDRRN